MLFVVIEGILRGHAVSRTVADRAVNSKERGDVTKTERKEIGLAIVGCGTIGRIRAEFARAYPGVGWIGLCDLKSDLGQSLSDDVEADFFTTDYRELLTRPEVTATIIATDENFHFDPTMLAIEQGHDLFIEKPLATDARQSAKILAAIEAAGVDAVVGYTQRFRRRFLAIKEKLITGQIGEVHSVVTRAFMNRMVPIATMRRTQDRATLTPMVVSGTHSLDMSMWLMEGKDAGVGLCAIDRQGAGQMGHQGFDLRRLHHDDGTIWSMNISWALPEVWPGAVYGIEIGIVGTEGVIDIEDTHRDLVLGDQRRTGRRLCA